MKSPESLQCVNEFHTTFDHPVLKTPQIPDDARANLRIALLKEELDELIQAVKDKNIVEAADAFCDIQYVLSGAILEFGLGDKFHDLFMEVQRSNMSKACKTKEEAEKTVAFYKSEKNVDCYIREKDGMFLVYRSGDHKTLKSVFYSPADLKSIIEK